MYRLFFCPLCHRFFKEESRVLRVHGGPEPTETEEMLTRKALEFLGIQEKPTEGLEVDFRVVCKLCISTDEGGASHYW